MNCLDSIRAKMAGVEKDYDDAVIMDVEFDSAILWAELNLIIQELGSQWGREQKSSLGLSLIKEVSNA